MAAVVLAVVAAAFVGPVAHAQPDEDAAAEAAQAIAEAKERANEAAAAWAQAGFELETLEAEADVLEQDRAALQTSVDALRITAERAAVERLMSSGSTGIPVLTGYQQPMDQLSARSLADIASGVSDNAFDEFDISARDLQRKADELASKQAEVESQRAEYDELSTAALAEVEHLEEVEQQRLADEQVRLAYEAQQREEARQRAEQAAAEAAQRAAEEAQRASDEAAAAAASSASSSSEAAAASAAASGDLVPAPVPLSDSGDSGDSVDATTAASGGGGGLAVSAGMPCPVQGPMAYSDTWGAARSGGRRHEGVDIISPEGTTLVAVASGNARYWTNSTGALGVSITADDGTRYYYGHLVSYEGSDRRVSVGEVVGYVGSTGATSVSHLHFEIHPGGGEPVNPYPAVVAAGC